MTQKLTLYHKQKQTINLNHMSNFFPARDLKYGVNMDYTFIGLKNTHCFLDYKISIRKISEKRSFQTGDCLSHKLDADNFCIKPPKCFLSNREYPC